MRKLVNIGNKNIECLVKGDGKSTVVIHTGMACTMYDWLNVIDEISKYSKVIIFHRAGCGESDLAEEKSCTTETVEDLNLLLEKLEITEPIILVGHSYGGLCTQHFVKKYPQKIASVVLVDSTSVDSYKIRDLEFPISDKEFSDEAWIEKWKRYAEMNTDELIEELKPELHSKQLKLEKEIQNELLNFYVNPNLYKTLAEELENWYDDCSKIKSMGDFPNIPLKILLRDSQSSIKSAIEDDGMPECEAIALENMWQHLVKEQTKLSNKSELIITDGADHCIHATRPDVVIDSIKSFIK